MGQLTSSDGDSKSLNGCGLQRKKQIEAKVYELRVKLEDQGYAEEEIVEREKALREKLSGSATQLIKGRG